MFASWIREILVEYFLIYNHSFWFLLRGKASLDQKEIVIMIQRTAANEAEENWKLLAAHIQSWAKQNHIDSSHGTKWTNL